MQSTIPHLCTVKLNEPWNFKLTSQCVCFNKGRQGVYRNLTVHKDGKSKWVGRHKEMLTKTKKQINKYHKFILEGFSLFNVGHDHFQPFRKTPEKEFSWEKGGNKKRGFRNTISIRYNVSHVVVYFKDHCLHVNWLLCRSFWVLTICMSIWMLEWINVKLLSAILCNSLDNIYC